MVTIRVLAVASMARRITSNKITLPREVHHTAPLSRLVTGKELRPPAMVIPAARHCSPATMPTMHPRHFIHSQASPINNPHTLVSQPVLHMDPHSAKCRMNTPSPLNVWDMSSPILLHTTPSFSGSTQSQYGSSYKGHGRGGFPHPGRGAHAPASDRGDKFRHRDQKPHQVFNNQKSDPAAAKKKKRKTNTLGLTPGDDDSDAGVDEEKRLEELLGADAPSIPDGDIAKWLAARKENYPTKARIAAKKEAGLIPKPEADANNSKEAVAVQVDPVEKEADRLRKRLAKLDRKIEKRKRAPNDEGDDMRSGSSDDESEDDKPEALPTNKPSTGFLPPPSITRADPSNHCKYYSTGGICGKKGKCRFVHDPAVREAALQERTRNGGRMTLKQRLLLNDKDQEDMDLIKEIVNMRSNGRLHDPQNPQIHAERQAREQAAIAAVSSLPSAPGAASLPPNPYAHLKNAEAARYRKPKKFNDWSPAAKYQGWNKLAGYGGTGVPPKQLPPS
ncbi:hypothetical protein AAE478_002480 [Parahypoxylon ruwenzoriense]